MSRHNGNFGAQPGGIRVRFSAPDPFYQNLTSSAPLIMISPAYPGVAAGIVAAMSQVRTK
jgi:hypothetical protein